MARFRRRLNDAASKFHSSVSEGCLYISFLLKGEIVIKEIVLYSTGCPRCGILKSKLEEKDIPYHEVTDLDTIIGMGIKEVPVLRVGGTEPKMMGFRDAVKWVQDGGYQS